MLTQEQADRLIEMLKNSVSHQVFDWYENMPQNEFFVDAETEKYALFWR